MDRKPILCRGCPTKGRAQPEGDKTPPGFLGSYTLSRGPNAFYDPVTGDLDPRYQVHMDRLRTLRDEVSYIVERAGTLRGQVRVELERLR